MWRFLHSRTYIKQNESTVKYPRLLPHSGCSRQGHGRSSETKAYRTSEREATIAAGAQRVAMTSYIELKMTSYCDGETFCWCDTQSLDFLGSSTEETIEDSKVVALRSRTSLWCSFLTMTCQGSFVLLWAVSSGDSVISGAVTTPALIWSTVHGD